MSINRKDDFFIVLSKGQGAKMNGYVKHRGTKLRG